MTGVGRDGQQEGEHTGGPQRQGGGPGLEWRLPELRLPRQTDPAARREDTGHHARAENGEKRVLYEG